MIFKMLKKKIRPLTPHLFIYKIQKNSYKSIKGRLLTLYCCRAYIFFYLKLVFIGNLSFQIFLLGLNFLIYSFYFSCLLLFLLFMLSHILKKLMFKISVVLNIIANF